MWLNMMSFFSGQKRHMVHFHRHDKKDMMNLQSISLIPKTLTLEAQKKLNDSNPHKKKDQIQSGKN